MMAADVLFCLHYLHFGVCCDSPFLSKIGLAWQFILFLLVLGCLEHVRPKNNNFVPMVAVDLVIYFQNLDQIQD